MSLQNLIYMHNIKKTLDTIIEAAKMHKEMPNLYGACNCGYEGSFKHQGTQLNTKGEYAFSLYNCPKCESTLSAESIITNQYKKK